MSDVDEIEDELSVDIGWLSSDMASAGWLLVVKDGNAAVGRLADDLRRSAANLERLDARDGDAPLVSEDKLPSSLDIGSAITLEVFKDKLES
jgi:hypothetical protein